MDSRKIVAVLEDVQPTPSLHLESDILPKVEEQVIKIRTPLVPIWAAKIPRNVLGPRSSEYFLRTRAERHGGVPLDELEKKGNEQVDQLWAESKPAIDKVASMLKENGGPYFMGSTGLVASYCFHAWDLG
jgi:hypothetical protein